MVSDYGLSLPVVACIYASHAGKIFNSSVLALMALDNLQVLLA
jgi:hypothetical protein